jgi:nitroreductase family protein
MPTAEIDPEAVRETLQAALRAPSAHNAQPWRLSQISADTFLLWYAFADKLLADPGDRDGIIAVGGFYETLRLASEARGLRTTFKPDLVDRESGISLGTVTFSRLHGDPDPLAIAIERRQCNRHRYARAALPPDLVAGLETLGNVLLSPARVVDLVSRASVLSWKDERFVSDLREWTRFDDVAVDGMTFDCLRINRFDALALRVALRLGRLPGWLAWIYAQRDARLTRASSAMAVLTVESRTPANLFDCGQRLIRSWTLINSVGYAWHPMSVVIDQATVSELATLIGGRDPVAIYRVGSAEGPAAWSQRRPLEALLVQPPT